jgi:hypothetical protein
MTITHPSQRYIISNLDWVDHGAVWRFDALAVVADVIDVSPKDGEDPSTRPNRGETVLAPLAGAAAFAGEKVAR